MKRRMYWGICGVSTAVLTLFFALSCYLSWDAVCRNEEILGWLLLTWLALEVMVFSFAGWLCDYIFRPLNELDPQRLSQYRGDPSLKPLLDRLKWQNHFIENQMAELRRRQDEFKSITDNMSEAFLVIGHQREILSYNAAALRFLGALPEKVKGNVLPEGGLSEACTEALEGKRTEQALSLRGSYFRVLANPVYHRGEITGAVLVILDVTEKERNESIRREFTANVSHELKTPLTTIYGTAEMLCGNMIRPEDTPRFLQVIYDESGRLIHLVEDILRLSRLDENQAPGEKQTMDLYECACKVAYRLESLAQQNEVDLQVRGSSTLITAVPTLIDEMIFNLCENAIKYNRKGGKVDVQIHSGKDMVMLRVRDTGIGIPYEHQSRVFERFYRVDKSHSRAMGGTGLGLSIVRHGAAFHGAKLSMHSVPGEGTEVTLIFPQNGASLKNGEAQKKTGK